jgi:acetyl esterase/lipase
MSFLAGKIRPDLLAALREPRICPDSFSEHIFKVVSGHSLQLRVFPATNPQPGAPWVVWTHGGGWCSGNHLAPPQWMKAGFLDRGVHLVTHAYRLAPQASIADMVQDSLDAVAWARLNLPAILGPGNVDIDRLAISGDSAGGNLCALLGFKLNPPPKVVVPIYAATDLVDLTFGREPGAWSGRWPEEELVAAINDRSPKSVCSVALYEQEHIRFPVEELQTRWKASWLRYTERVLLQASLAQYMGVKRLLLPLALRKDEYPDEETFNAAVRTLSPLHVLDKAPTYPPTVLLHGEADALVPVDQSRRFADKLRSKQVPVLELYEPGGPHVFDQVYYVSTTCDRRHGGSWLINSERERGGLGQVH